MTVHDLDPSVLPPLLYIWTSMGQETMCHHDYFRGMRTDDSGNMYLGSAKVYRIEEANGSSRCSFCPRQ